MNRIFAALLVWRRRIWPCIALAGWWWLLSGSKWSVRIAEYSGPRAWRMNVRLDQTYTYFSRISANLGPLIKITRVQISS